MIIGGAHSVFTRPRSASGVQDAWVIHYTVAGHVRMRHPDGDLLGATGEVIIVQPGFPVSWEVPDPVDDGHGALPVWEVIWCICRATPEDIALLSGPGVRRGYSQFRLRLQEHRERVVAAMTTALELSNSSVYSRSGLPECALREALLWCRADRQMSEKRLSPLVLQALHAVDETLARPITAAAMARMCSVSRSTLMAAFSREMSVPLMAFREQQRMRRARHLLAAGALTVKQVAAEMGYGDPKYFSRRFRKCTGALPGAYRPRALNTGGEG